MGLKILSVLGVYMLLVLLAVAVAAVFGAVHDQISYTVSPEYYTRFKFVRFGLTDPLLPERMRASLVGIIGSWWMGLPVGLIVAPAAFYRSKGRPILKTALQLYGVAAAFTLLTGLGGLWYGWYNTRSIDLAQYQGWFIPDNLTDLRRFLCVGYMHNATYTGGAYSVVVVWMYRALTAR